MLLLLFKYLSLEDLTVVHNLAYPHMNLNSGINKFSMFMMEFIATWLLVFSIYLCGLVSTKPKDEVGSLTVGLTVGIAVASIAPYTGAALNPMRVFGPALCIGGLWDKDEYDYQWYLYFFAPMFGGMLAALMYRYILVYKRAY